MENNLAEQLAKHLNVIQESPLFSGITKEEITAMLLCLSAAGKSFAKNQFILCVGEETAAVGLVLSGCVDIIKEDYRGNCHIISKCGPGALFAEAYACSPAAALDVSVIAREATEVLFLNVRRILTVCTSACEFHTRLVANLLAGLAAKNLLLNQKLTHIGQRSTREKLLSYLTAEARRSGSSSFAIPFNRQQLADYLAVDRSAMSNELSKMRAEGWLTFERNCFTLTLAE